MMLFAKICFRLLFAIVELFAMLDVLELSVEEQVVVVQFVVIGYQRSSVVCDAAEVGLVNLATLEVQRMVAASMVVMMVAMTDPLFDYQNLMCPSLLPLLQNSITAKRLSILPLRSFKITPGGGST